MICPSFTRIAGQKMVIAVIVRTAQSGYAESIIKRISSTIVILTKDGVKGISNTILSVKKGIVKKIPINVENTTRGGVKRIVNTDVSIKKNITKIIKEIFFSIKRDG